MILQMTYETHRYPVYPKGRPIQYSDAITRLMAYGVFIKSVRTTDAYMRQ